MWIEYIKLKNFRQYIDEKIDFLSEDKNRNFIVFVAPNGAGKTNLVNAITWCLYGKELHQLKEKYSGLPLVNTTILRDMEPGAITNVEVELMIADEDIGKILIKRTQRFKKLEGQSDRVGINIQVMPVGDPSLNMLRLNPGEKDWTRVQDPVFMINRLIPESIEEYFFFDCERLDKYFQEAADEIRDAVFKVSQLKLLENAIEHLDKKKDSLFQEMIGVRKMKEVKDVESQIKNLSDQIDMYKRTREHEAKVLADLEAQRREAEQEERKYSKYLESSGNIDVAELEKRRNLISMQLEEDRKRLGELERERLAMLVKIMPKIVGKKAMDKTRELIAKKIDAGEIPPDFSEKFIEKILKTGYCICGTDISNSDEAKKRLLALIKEHDKLSNLSRELLDLYRDLDVMSRDVDLFEERKTYYDKQIYEIEERIKKNTIEVNKISDMLTGFNIEQIREWEKRLQDWRKTKDNISEKIGRKKADIEQIQREISELEKERNKAIALHEKYKEVSRYVKFCEECLRIAKKVKDEIMRDVKNEIERKTKEQFLELIWKEKTYTDVKIDDNYNISVIHESGMEGIGTLSAGERQVLALSFMAALNSVSGFDAPIIIDTPLGRISKEPKINIAKNLANYLKGKQVTLLVTEEEYTPEVAEKLRANIAKEYKIEFVEQEVGNLAKVVEIK
jgi:DNA sulfur modification protein DndD